MRKLGFEQPTLPDDKEPIDPPEEEKHYEHEEEQEFSDGTIDEQEFSEYDGSQGYDLEESEVPSAPATSELIMEEEPVIQTLPEPKIFVPPTSIVQPSPIVEPEEDIEEEIEEDEEDKPEKIVHNLEQSKSDKAAKANPKSPLNKYVDTTLRWLLAPSNVLLVAGKKRTGKSHILAWLMWYAATYLNYQILTNMVFKRRQPNGEFIKDYPPGVKFCNSLWQVMVETARVMSETDQKILIVMDELQNFISAYEWNSPLARQFVIFLGIISKLRQTYVLATPDPTMFPRGIKDPNADVATCLFYKDISHTYDFNDQAGTDYRTKELMFLERPGCKKEVWTIGVCPWARPEHTVKVGEYVYDHMVPGSAFTLGQIGDYTFNFKDVVAALEGTIAEEIPTKLVNYVRRFSAYEEMIQETSGPAWPEISREMSQKEKKKVEKEIILPYMANFTDLKASELAGRGLSYSDAHLFSMYRSFLKQAGRDE